MFKGIIPVSSLNEEIPKENLTDKTMDENPKDNQEEIPKEEKKLPEESSEKSDNKESEDDKSEDKSKSEDPVEELGDVADKIEDIPSDEATPMSDEELDKLLSELEDKNAKATDGLEENFSEETAKQTIVEKDAVIKALSDKLTTKINKVAELTLENAEISMYGSTAPKEITIISANFSKAKEGDQAAKDKVLSMLDTMRKDLIGQSFGEKDMEDKNKAISDSQKISGGVAPDKPEIKKEEQIRVL